MKLYKAKPKAQTYRVVFDTPKSGVPSSYNRRSQAIAISKPIGIDDLIASYKPIMQEKFKQGMQILDQKLGLTSILDKAYNTGNKIRNILYTPVGDLYKDSIFYMAGGTKPKKAKKKGRQKQTGGDYNSQNDNNNGGKKNKQEKEKGLDFSKLSKTQRKLPRAKQVKILIRMKKNEEKKQRMIKARDEGKTKIKKQKAESNDEYKKPEVENHSSGVHPQKVNDYKYYYYYRY